MPAAKRPKKTASGYKMPEHLDEGTMLKDLMKKEWTLGSSIGIGGFGEIYLAGEGNNKPSKDNAKYVVKIEPKENGPLFVEMHFYIQVGTADQMKGWTGGQVNMPLMRGQGSYKHKDDTYRFLVIDRFGTDLDKNFLHGKNPLSEDTIGTAAIQIIKTLEYIHSKGYTHNDVKAANLLFGLGKDSTNIFLVDFGLCVKYIKPDGHKEYKADPRKAHDGTIEYLSRDAHIGCTSRRSDLEVLAFNMYHWFTGQIPWAKVLTDPLKVEAEKKKFMSSVPESVQNLPKSMQKFFQYINNLKFEEAPNYDYCRDLFKSSWKSTGGKVIVGQPAKPKTPKSRKNSLPKASPARQPAKRTKKPAKSAVESADEDIEIDEESDGEDMFAATPPSKQARNGTPRRAAALAGARGTPRNAAAGARGTPQSARRTPVSTNKVKPVTKYKDTGCQTSPGFVRRAKHSNGDVNGDGAINGDNNENEPAKANGVKVVKKKAAKEPKTAPTAASTKRKAKESPDEKTKEQDDSTANMTPAMLEVIRRKKEKEEEKAAARKRKK